MGLVPLGIVCKKALRYFVRSSSGLSNQERILDVPLLYSFGALFVASCSIFITWNTSASGSLWPLASLTSLLIGSRLSVVGLTGGIASGKTTAARYIADKHGWVVIDADRVAREVVVVGSSGYQRIVESFGQSVINKTTMELDRQELGRIIFSDPKKKRDLESITHPRIVAVMLSRLIWNRLCGRKAILDVPLMFESRSPILNLFCSEIVLIDVSESTQKRRLSERNPELSTMDVENRISSQTPRNFKQQRADYVLNNDGSVFELYSKLDEYFS
jgi:dephospho-CoA kinase